MPSVAAIARSGTLGRPVRERATRKAAVMTRTWAREKNCRPSSLGRSTAWLDREISRAVATDTNSAGTALTKPSPIVSRE
jgi:hypothetical protein